MAATVALYARPESSEDSSAPRRQLDGGVAPAADGRGRGQAVLSGPCCCAVPGCCSPRRRLPGGASNRQPAVGRPRRGRQCQDASHGVGRRSASSMRCPPIRVRLSSPSGVQPVRCPARPVSGHLGSSSGVRRPGRLVSTHPASDRVVSTCPASSPLVSAPSVRTRPSPPTSGGGVGDQMGAAGQPAPRERVEVPVAAAPSSGSVSGRGLDDRGRRYRSRALVGGVSAADPAWVRAVVAALARCPTRQARPACGAHVAGGCAVGTEQAAARGCRTGGVAAVLGWVRDHGGWLSRSLRSGWTGPAGPMGLPASGGAAAPARPRLVASHPGWLPAAL
jgi:hypothetical protein